MAFAYKDRVKETTTTTGTGAFTLDGAVTGFRRFQDAFSTSDTMYFGADNGAGEWEVGLGTLAASTTLNRTTVLASSNSGSAVNFSAGTKNVWCDVPAVAIGPGGSDGQVQYNNAGAFGGVTGLTLTTGTLAAATFAGAANSNIIAATGYSLTGSNAQSLIDLAGTWNTSGTPTAIKLNITDTASNSASLLLDLQTNNTSRFKVREDGAVNIFNNTNPSLNNISGYMGLMGISGGNGILLGANGTGTTSGYMALKDSAVASQIAIRSTYSFGWASTSDPTGTMDVLLARDAANTLALRNSANAQTFRAYNTYTDSSNGEWGTFDWATSNVLTIGTNKNGTGSTRNLRFVVGGTNVLDYGVTAASTWSMTGAIYTSANGSASACVYAAGTINSGLYFDSGWGPAIAAGGTAIFAVNGTYGIVQRSTGLLSWSASALASLPDLSLTRNAAGVVKVTNQGGSGAGAVLYTPATTANLPAAPSNGMVAAVTDANAPAVGSTVASGGSAKALVWYNGTNWTVIGV